MGDIEPDLAGPRRVNTRNLVGNSDRVWGILTKWREKLAVRRRVRICTRIRRPVLLRGRPALKRGGRKGHISLALTLRGPRNPFHVLAFGTGSVPPVGKGSRKNNFPEFAPRFKSDWVDLMERNHRRSKAHVEDFASKDRPKMG